MDDSRSQEEASPTDFPGGSFYSPEFDVSARQTWIHAVVYVFHVAKFKKELTEYFTEVTQSEVKEFFRPNLWPNTPDILHEYLQHGGRPAFMARLVLASTLGSNYGIYGPAYELCENVPREPGSEEYLNSEKYEVKTRNLHDPASLRAFISRVNAIRKRTPRCSRMRASGSTRSKTRI
jgi:starch synthase (maltosyl-transferring)